MNHSNSAPAPGDVDFNNSDSSSTLTHQKSSNRSPQPDGGDSQQQQIGIKRNNNSNNNNYQYLGEGATFFKILVPSIAAGAIIGKGGETIALLQQETQTRIKMSKATDYFPGTNERVCIIYGPNVEGILEVHDFIAQKIREKPDPNSPKTAMDYDTKQPADRDKQVKILVPNSTAGMIIGKAGNYIKFIKEESGAYVQISQKAKDHAITERCITIIGDVNQNRRACALVLAKIFEDPQSNSCPNLSYADIIGPVPNYNPTGSPFANIVHGSGPQGHMDHNSMAPFGGNPNHFFSNLRNTLRLSGYSEDATSEIIAAMSTLANYGILGLGLGIGGLNMGYMSPMQGINNNSASVDSGYNVHSTGSSLASGLSTSSMGGSPGAYSDGMASSSLSASKSPLRYAAGPHDANDSGYAAPHYDHHQQHLQSHPQQQQHQAEQHWGGSQQRGPRWGQQNRGMLQQQQQHYSNGMFANGSGVVSGDATVPNGAAGGPNGGEKTQITIDINENLVGALFGRDGKNISEIQALCGAQIQVAKQKVSPGRRGVTITGPQSAVQMTQMMIAQRLSQTEEKRIQSENNIAASQSNPSPQQQLPLSPSSQFS